MAALIPGWFAVYATSCMMLSIASSVALHATQTNPWVSWRLQAGLLVTTVVTLVGGQLLWLAAASFKLGMLLTSGW